MAITHKEIIEALEGMKIQELNELVKAIEEHFGVVAAAAVAASVGGEEEKSSEVDVVLTELGQSKVAVIKIVGKITGKGLMEAKKMLDKLPVVVKSKVDPEQGEELRAELAEAGATVELK